MLDISKQTSLKPWLQWDSKVTVNMRSAFHGLFMFIVVSLNFYNSSLNTYYNSVEMIFLLHVLLQLMNFK